MRVKAGTWRLIIGDGATAPRHPGAEPGAAPGAVNMAIDQSLMEGVRDGAPPAVRFYRWTPGCLSFGRNQPARGRYDAGAAAARGIDIVRRPTGGLAVYHDRELTYSVAAPVSEIGKPRAAYQSINRALAAGLRHLGVPVVLVREGGPGGALGSGPCFHEGAPGEVLAEGKKLVGSAQRCEARTILQHGSLLLEGDQVEVVELELPPAAAIDDGRSTIDGVPGGFRVRGATTSVAGGHDVRGAATAFPGGDRIRGAATAFPGGTSLAAPSLSATSLAAVLGTAPDLGALVSALAAGFEAELGVALEPGSLTEAERERARELEAQYRSDAWTWRR